MDFIFLIIYKASFLFWSSLKTFDRGSNILITEFYITTLYIARPRMTEYFSFARFLHITIREFPTRHGTFILPSVGNSLLSDVGKDNPLTLI